MDFYESWEYLNDLQIVQYKGVNQFHRCLSIEVVKVNPITEEIDSNEELNIKTVVWLEFGGIVYDDIWEKPIPEHDIDFDCGLILSKKLLLN